MMLLMYMSEGKIVTGLENNKATGNDGIPSEVVKFASERLPTMMSIFLSGCMLTGELQSTLTLVLNTTLVLRGSRSKVLSRPCCG